MLKQMTILDMFARSPIRPLQKHMKKAHACAQLLDDFFNEVISQHWPVAVEIQAKIQQLEEDADKLKHDMRMHLPKGLFLPVARGDLLSLLSKQEALANRAEDIVGIVVGRKIDMPQHLRESFMAFLRRSIDAAAQAKKAICELDELLESGFRGKEITIVGEMIQELNVIEDDTDTMQVELCQKLFDIEKDLQPVDVIFLYKIFEKVGSLADCAQEVGSSLQILLAR